MKFIYFFLILAFMISCSEETPFTDKPFSNTFATPAAGTYTNIHCANSTTINPQVDILFLIDNSTSTFYIPNDLKNQIVNLLSDLSNYDFDYHAMVAPLLNDGGALEEYPVLATDPSDFNASVNYTTPVSLSLFGTTQSGSVELGFRRARDIINANKSNNVFRVNSNTLVITVSNGDDTDYAMNSLGHPMYSYFPARVVDLKKLTAQYYNNVSPPQSALMSRQLRFISIVAHSTTGNCNGFKIGNFYRKMSREIYNYSGQTDQGAKVWPDSYDFCSGSFSNIFADISASIPALYVPHTYDYWPVRDVNPIDFNASVIEVKKVIKGVSGDTVVNIPVSATNGFQFVNSYLTNHNIREIPVASPAYPPEDFNGYFVQLFGSGKVTSPDCLIVKLQDPNVFYGYVTIPKQPKLDETIVKKNGVTLTYIANPVPSSDGWTYQGYSPSRNIVIQGPGDHTPGSPGELKEGYVIKLLGTDTYTNEDVIQVHYRTVTN